MLIFSCYSGLEGEADLVSRRVDGLGTVYCHKIMQFRDTQIYMLTNITLDHTIKQIYIMYVMEQQA